MQYVKKSRLPIWAWILIIAIFATIIVAATLHLVGIIDLGFLGVWFLGTFQWAGVDIVNASMVTILYTAGLGLFFYFIIKYFVGQKVVIPTAQPQYNAQVGLAQPTIYQTEEKKPQQPQEVTSK
jgi:hypothetical protein